MKITEDEQTLLIVSSVRYALGRQSYIVSWMCDFILKNKERISQHVLELIIRDVEIELDLQPSVAYANEWQKLLELCKQHLQERREKSMSKLGQKYTS